MMYKNKAAESGVGQVLVVGQVVSETKVQILTNACGVCRTCRRCDGLIQQAVDLTSQTWIMDSGMTVSWGRSIGSKWLTNEMVSTSTNVTGCFG